MQLLKLITAIGIATLIGGITFPAEAEPISQPAPTLLARKDRSRSIGIYIQSSRRPHRGKIPRSHVLRRRRLGQFYRDRRYRRYPRGLRQGYFHQRHPLRIYYRQLYRR